MSFIVKSPTSKIEVEKQTLDPSSLTVPRIQDLFINTIKGGDPHVLHQRDVNTMGASNTNVCNLKKMYDILYKELYNQRDYNCSLLIGSSIGYYIEYILSELYANVTCEEPVLFQYTSESGVVKTISSAIDVFIRDPDVYENSIIIDIKTTSKDLSNWFNDISGYISQVNWYMGVKKVRKAYLVVISYRRPFAKIEDCIAVYEVRFNRFLFEKDLNNFIDIFKAFDNNRVPSCIKEFCETKYDCAYCSAFYVCPKVYRFALATLFDNGYVKNNHTKDEQYVLDSIVKRYPDLFKKRAGKLAEFDFNISVYNRNRINSLEDFDKRLKSVSTNK